TNTLCFLFLFNDTATTEIYTLSLHDALPICEVDNRLLRGWHASPTGNADVFAQATRDHLRQRMAGPPGAGRTAFLTAGALPVRPDRKSTRLNSSHVAISYAVFCLKKKKHISP